MPTGHRPVGPASRGAASHGSLLQLIRRSEGMTRQDLLRATGMSRSTLVQRLGELEQARLVHEAGQRDSTGGRPAKSLRFDDRRKAVLTFDAGQTGATVSLCNLRAEPLASRSLALGRVTDAAELVTRLAEAAAPLLAAHPDQQLVGVGLAVPAPVRSVAGDRWWTEALPDVEHPLAADLERRYGVPAVVENDARAMALGDHGDAGGDGVFLSVKYATGIGAGILSDGRLLSGSTGAAGDIGHIRVAETGPECTCGAQGCLASFASGRALLRSLGHRGCTNLAQLVTLLDEGDAEVVAEVDRAAYLLGRQVAALVQALNPTRVSLGGTLGRHPLVADRVLAAIQDHVLPRVSQHAAMYPSPLGHLAGTVGLVRLVGDTVFAPQRIDDLIEVRVRQAP